MLVHGINNAKHNKINDICMALTLFHCKNNAHSFNDICTEAPGGAGKHGLTYELLEHHFSSTWRQPCTIETSREAWKTSPEVANRRPGTQRRHIILMLILCRSNAIHCKTNDLCIAVMLMHCKSNVKHCKMNDICVASMLIHYNNKASRCKTNDMCTTVLLTHCKNNANHYELNDTCMILILIHREMLNIVKSMICVLP